MKADSSYTEQEASAAYSRSLRVSCKINKET